ncbi:helix-turn-helix domain-containing protein [Deinococcus frigens]|uniref:helix-turn-helix domain-containing protein n=1 Tax=Deinococcus frigens TaxID=249403 RepID=UPI00068D6243|nr:helix-turn-helix domain-containing protein [Deinococcus frigens]
MPHTILGSYGGEWFTASTPEQARLLSDPAALRHLEPFIGRTLAAGAAAKQTGVSVERMLYRVRQFLKAGLLEQVDEERRAGRPVRLYRAPGGLRVPFALTPFADLAAQVARHSLPYDRLRARAGGRRLHRLEPHARLIYRDDGGRDDARGEVHSETETLGPEALAAHPSRDFMGVMWLDDATAHRMSGLMDEWRDLLGRGGSRREGAQPYLIQMVLLALDPQEPDELLGPPG